MKQTPLLLVTLILLVFGAGCTDSVEVNASENTTPAPVLYYEQENTSITLNLSEVTVDVPGNFTANVTMVLETLLADQRPGFCLRTGGTLPRFGWPRMRMTRTGRMSKWSSGTMDCRSSSGSTKRPAGRSTGVAGRVVALDTRIGALPEGYHQATDKSTKTYHVFDERNKRVAMIYNDTTIFYLYPSYSIINMEGILG